MSGRLSKLDESFMSQETEEPSKIPPNGKSQVRERSKFMVPGRSILKQKLLYNDGGSENLTLSNIPVFSSSQEHEDADGRNNTTSRLNTSKLQSKLDRRVSFAPDVTLHRVDFVPQQRSTFREPRRKPASEILVDEIAKEEVQDSQDHMFAEESMQLTEHYGRAHAGNSTILSPERRDQKALYIPAYDKEVSMEITQLFSKHSAGPENNSQEINGDRQISAHPSEEDMEVTQLQKAGPQNGDDGESMIMTEVFRPQSAVNISSLTGPGNNSKNSEGEASDMETTEVVRTHQEGFSEPNSVPFIKNLPHTTSLTVHTQSEPDIIDMKSSQFVTSTQRDTEERKSNVQKSSGVDTRGQLYDENITRKKRRVGGVQDFDKGGTNTARTSQSAETDDDMEITMMERLSPIDISINLSESLRTHITKDNTNATSHFDNYNPRADLDKTSQHSSLKAFLDAVGVSSLLSETNSELLPVNKMSFLSSHKERIWPVVDVYYGLYANMPILEIYAFCCKELLRRISKSRELFKELEEEIAHNPAPALFKRFFESGTTAREKLSSQIALLRSFSRLEAEKVWLEWRSRHLNGIKNVLQENLLLLKDELNSIMDQVDKVGRAKKNILNIRQNILAEIRLAQSLTQSKSSSPGIPDRLKLEALKTELAQEMQALKSSSDFEKKIEDVRSDIKNVKFEIKRTRSAIDSLKSKVKESPALAAHQAENLRATFDIVQKICGISFKNYHKSLLAVQVHAPPIIVSFDIKRDQQVGDVNVLFPNSLEGVAKEVYTRSVRTARSCEPNVYQFVKALSQDSFNSRLLLAEYKRLQLLLPCRIIETGSSVDIEITCFDSSKRKFLLLDLPLNEFILAVKGLAEGGPKLRARGLYSERLQLEDALRFIQSKVSDALPWLKEPVIS
ncbi:LAQU0S08e04830g1_1 [Lachancea quebecensis]|uniref:LAQU0S08e04830g1_1 n=1 Tax=Lachancea quebecensis TaxID=1654605 RepID=A0A0P1KTF3_9SACH|nr:LAQU0S08e04830g1_1 [Lachancea quebecensis]